MVPTASILKPIKSVMIANIGEFYLPVFCQFHEKEVETWTKKSMAECDMALFWGGNDKIVITPEPIDQMFVSDISEALEYHNVHIVSPPRASESLCADIQADPEIFAFLTRALRDSEKPQVVSWGATKPFYSLLDRLRQEGVDFTTPEVPTPDNYWTVPYLDSKCGFRETCAHLSIQAPEIRMPRGYICADVDMAARIVKSGRFAPDGVVVKANNGVGGYGTLLYTSERFQGCFDIEAHLHGCIRLMPIFSAGTIIVEAHIENDNRSDIASPSIQGIVDPEGKVNITCLVAQIIGIDGRYIGALIGPDIFPKSLVKRLKRIGSIIGGKVAALGYRGVFNIDTILGKDGHIYCVELNARRTSVKYIIDIATHLFGRLFVNSVAIISIERLQARQLINCCYSDVRFLLRKLLFPIGGNRRGVIVTKISSLDHFVSAPQLGLVVIDEDINVARAIYSEVCQLLG